MTLNQARPDETLLRSLGPDPVQPGLHGGEAVAQ